MSKNIRFKRGNKTKLPSSAPSGMPLWCEDTEELYIGTGNGRSKVGGDSVSEALVNQKLNNYVPKTQLASKEQTGIMKVGNNLDVNESGQVSGVKVEAGIATSVTQAYLTSASAVSTNSNLNITTSYSGANDKAGKEVLEFIACGTPLDTTKYSGGTKDCSRVTRYFIRGGYLYYHNTISADDIVQVGSSNGWTDVCGSGYTNSTNYNQSISYGICNGYLYALRGTDMLQLSTQSGWTQISGSYSYYGTNYTENGYAICNGKLYALMGETVTQVGSLTNWTKISGYHCNLNTHYAYGIAGGYLYAIAGTTATKVGTLSTWTDITGYSVVGSDWKDYCYGIAGGYLYSLNGTTATKIGSESGWTKVTGRHSTYSNDNRQYAYGIRNGYLYRIDLNTVAQISSNNNWTQIVGYSTNLVTSDTHTYAYGICGGCLYSIQSSNIVQIGTSNKWTYISGNQNSDNGNVGAYGICNGELYGITPSTLYELAMCGWKLNGSFIELANYGISVKGLIQSGDKIIATFLTELTNTISYTAPYIVSQTVSGFYHCRIWSNKFCEQWSQFAGSGKSGTITLPKAYKDTNYVLVSAEGGHNGLSSSDTEGVDFVCLFSNLTTSSFRYSSASGRQFTWYTAGYIN